MPDENESPDPSHSTNQPRASHSRAAETSDVRLTEYDGDLFRKGVHRRLADKLGAHVTTRDGFTGVQFTVWAPHASAVSVMGDWNDWSPRVSPMRRHEITGFWEVFLSGLSEGARYKYRVIGPDGVYTADKADPFAFQTEIPPARASVVWSPSYEWSDDAWMLGRAEKQALSAPISFYEVHLGSWMRGENNRMLSYRELAPLLADHVTRLGFTHVELLPVMEHPFHGSWGYQVTSFFAPTSRLGRPEDLMFLIDHLHQRGIGVILDWVPSHFPTDEHGLGFFDGTHLFEKADPRQGFHPDWGTFIFDYERPEVRSFLLSSADTWMRRFHADGLRVDAVASMLYLDYSRKPGEWIPNRYGGRENLDAVTFLRDLNSGLYADFPDAQIIAEESTSWPMVSRPLYIGGLGFGMKWDMGWMHDTLRYLKTDPLFRSYSHNNITFRQTYSKTENFVLSMSHDEVVHGKGSLLGKMPGDTWQRFANLRLLLAYQWAQTGKKLLFMGGEFGQEREWNHDQSLDWNLLDSPAHQGILQLVTDLNALYRAVPSLHDLDCDDRGFEWVDANDSKNSVLTFLRRGDENTPVVLIAINFTPIPRHDYRVGVPYSGTWREALNTDSPTYGGSGLGNLGSVQATNLAHHGKHYSVSLTLPPLAAVFLVGESPRPETMRPPPPPLSSGPGARAPKIDETLHHDSRSLLSTAPRKPLARGDRTRGQRAPVS